jgi:hypothetical protein
VSTCSLRAGRSVARKVNMAPARGRPTATRGVPLRGLVPLSERLHGSLSREEQERLKELVTSEKLFQRFGGLLRPLLKHPVPGILQHDRGHLGRNQPGLLR